MSELMIKKKPIFLGIKKEIAGRKGHEQTKQSFFSPVFLSILFYFNLFCFLNHFFPPIVVNSQLTSF
jgi:hypothetical protein